MKKLIISLGGALAVALVVVAGVAAAGPGPGPGASPRAGQEAGGDVVAAILKLSQEEVAALRADGLSLAQIAEKRGVDPQKLIDALVIQWSARVDARVANGALTADEAAKLKADLVVRAKAMVNQTAAGGMQGATVGAGPAAMGRGQGRMTGDGAGAGQGGRGFGPANGAGFGGNGDGVCDGTGPSRAGQG